MSSASSSNGEDELHHVLNEARDLGYLGPGPVAVHRAHSLAFGRACAPFLNSSALRIADLGSGGGLPGLELALAWPASRWVFLDVNQRRMATLEIALDRLRISGRATIALGHELGLRVVAEGIEKQEEAELLEQMGVDVGQGFLWSKPVPAEEITAMIAGPVRFTQSAQAETMRAASASRS